MSDPAASAAAEAPPPLRALLVGIDRYLPRRRSDLPLYPSLHGAVRDVELVDQLLTGALEVPCERIRRLVAPFGLSQGTGDELPTHSNLVAALLQLERECVSGDQALIYYSGHGGRAATARPELKGLSGLDECLVPMNIGDPAVGYVRDLEIDAWLARMEAKGVFVTLVLDCCHSGGIPRRNRRYRGIDDVDRSSRPTESPLAGREQISAAWSPEAGREVGEVTRSVRLSDKKLFRPRGYALLAACRPQELAIEDSFDGGPPCGAMTHFLLAALREQVRGATYRQLHAGLVARVHSRYPGQTPVLEGEGDRLIFGRQELPTLWGVNVLAIEEEGETGGSEAWVVLNTGAVQGVQAGARFAIYPASVRDATQVGSRLASGTIDEVGSTSSRLRLDERPSAEVRIREGDQALLIDPGPAGLVRYVELVATVDGVGGETILEAVAAELSAEGDGLLAACPDDRSGDFQLSLDTAGCYRIADAKGQPVPNLGPSIAVGEPGGPREVARRLGHLARFSNLRALDNPDPSSPLHGRLGIVVEPLADHAEADVITPPNCEPASGVPAVPKPNGVRDGAWVRLTIHNDSPDHLNVAVLDFQPDWGVCQVFPAPSAGSFHPLDAGASISIPLQAFLPEGLDTGIDGLKAFASTGPVSFRWLELPALAEGPPDVAAWGPSRGDSRPCAPAGFFDRVLAAVGAERISTSPVRGLTAVAHEWVTSQVELRVVAAEG